MHKYHVSSIEREKRKKDPRLPALHEPGPAKKTIEAKPGMRSVCFVAAMLVSQSDRVASPCRHVVPREPKITLDSNRADT